MANDTLMKVPTNGVQIVVTRGISSRLAELGVTITPTGLSHERPLTEREKWELGEVLFEAQQATSVPIKWSIADWANDILEDKASRRGLLNDERTEKAKKTEDIARKYGLSYNTIRNIALVGRYFPSSAPRGAELRRAFVGTWSLYEELASSELTDQERMEWLDREARNPGTVTVARVKNVKKMKAEKRAAIEAQQQRIEVELKQPLPIPTVDIEADQNVLIDEANGIEYHTTSSTQNDERQKVYDKYGAPPPVPEHVERGVAARMEYLGELGAVPGGVADKQKQHEKLDKIWTAAVEDAAKKGISVDLWFTRAFQNQFNAT